MEEKEKPKIPTLPYVKEFGEKIEQAIKPLDIRAVFKIPTTIQQKVGKPSKEEVKGVIYKAPCERGAVYMGETGCNLYTRS